MTANKKILVIEDDISVTQSLTLHLKKAGYAVVTCYDGASGLENVKKERPDFVILDIMLPKMSGFEMCRRIRKTNPNLPVLMLTSKSEEADKVFGLSSGADDYLTKPFSQRELEARIKAIFRRAEREAKEIGPTRVMKHRDITVELDTRKVFVGKKLMELTPKEFELLKFFMRHPERVFSRDELLDNVWGYSFDGYDRTIDTHINRLRNKIEKNPDDPTYILSVYGVGYKMV